MSICERAAIVGLGLIGGSLARDLSALGVRVSGFDSNPEALAAAIDEQAVHQALDASLDDIGAADVIVLAVPVDAAVGVLERVARLAPRSALITDVGSTKAKIVDAATMLGLGDRFVGAHPMAGHHRSGWEASRAGLFDDARVYLCPAPEATSHARKLATAFWHALGGRAEGIDARDHDRKLAWASHLPHVISSAVALAMVCGGIKRDELGPGGRDITRLAGSSPELWTAIAGENAVALDEALAAAAAEIAEFRAALGREDRSSLHRRLVSARRWFDE